MRKSNTREKGLEFLKKGLDSAKKVKEMVEEKAKEVLEEVGVVRLSKIEMLSEMTLQNLYRICKDHKFRGYTKLKKGELVDDLNTKLTAKEIKKYYRVFVLGEDMDVATKDAEKEVVSEEEEEIEIPPPAKPLVEQIKEILEEVKIIGIPKNEDAAEDQLITHIARFEGFETRKSKRAMPAVKALGFSHIPDAKVKNVGVEIKYVTSGAAVQRALGQAIIYKRDYDNVVLFLWDATRNKRVMSAWDEDEEFRKVLEESGIYVLVK